MGEGRANTTQHSMQLRLLDEWFPFLCRLGSMPLEGMVDTRVACPPD